jgi:hypothetical protein
MTIKDLTPFFDLIMVAVVKGLSGSDAVFLRNNLTKEMPPSNEPPKEKTQADLDFDEDVRKMRNKEQPY